MMPIERGCVVQSIAGRDAGGFFVVLDVEGGFATIADGRLRKLEKPKRKRQKHLRRTNTVVNVAELTNDSQIRRSLSAVGPAKACGEGEPASQGR